MTVFSSRDFKNHELVAFGSDAATGLKCIAAVPSTQLGPALGGCRMWDYASATPCAPTWPGWPPLSGPG